jgi:tRNA(fMet)-specific endonuclease VapC
MAEGGRRAMLDTNVASRFIRASPSPMDERLTRASAVTISAITEGELRFGLARRPEAARLRAAVEAFLSRVEVLPWDRAAAIAYGEVRARMSGAGTALGALDMLIAAHALAADAVLVTGDKAFGRVPGLEVEDWGA